MVTVSFQSDFASCPNSAFIKICTKLPKFSDWEVFCELLQIYFRCLLWIQLQFFTKNQKNSDGEQHENPYIHST